jgi:hypothetical protein
MGRYNFPFISIAPNNGYREAMSGGGVVNFLTEAPMSNGKRPKFAYVVCGEGTSTNIPTINLTQSGLGATADDLPMPVAKPRPIILNVHGYFRVAYENVGAGDSFIWVYPLEDF